MAYYRHPHFPFRRPPELDGARPRYPVAVVGAGPVGLTAALELARHGVRPVVIDPKSSVSEGSRAICVSRRSLELLQPLGVSARFMTKALPWTHGSSYYRDRQVFRLEMPYSDDERYTPFVNLSQQYIEQFLVEQVDATPGIDLRWQSSVADITVADAGARLRIDTPQGSYDLEADYVIAADGARSRVRGALGLRLEGAAYEGRYLIADIHMAMDRPTERLAFFDPPANPGATVLVHKQPDDLWRIDYQLLPDADADAELAEPRVRERIGRILDMLGEHGAWTLEWWSLYKASTLALADYRHGPVLFAGDAAHLVPIFGVRGLNSGFADANNLGWKLAYVLRGLAPPRLLDSYTPERRAATLDAFASAAKSTQFMTPPSRGYELMRAAALELARTHAFTRALVNPRQSAPFDYLDSPLTTGPGGEPKFDAGPGPGAPLVNVRMGPDAFLLDALEAGFTALYFADGPGETAPARALREALCACGAPVHWRPVTLTGADRPRALARAYGARPGTLYLVRPDGHVCARSRTPDPAWARAALMRALGGGA